MKIPSPVTFDSGELASRPEIAHGLQRTWRGRLQVRIASAAAARIRLDVIGEDTLGGTIQALAARLGVDPHVVFHGFLPTDRLPAFYSKAHVYVQSSRHEAAPIAVLEAAAAGAPTVGTCVGYVSDWAPDAAVAVEVGDHAGLADAVVRVLLDRAERERLGAAAHARAIELDSDRTAARIEELYETLRRAPARRHHG